MRALLAAVLLIIVTGCSSTVRTGPWRATLETQGGELPFEFELSRTGGAWHATIVNGPERIDVPRTTVSDDRVTFEMPHYDSRIEARLSEDGTRMAVEFMLEDPEYIVGSMTHSRQLIYSPQLEMVPFNCDLEATRRFVPR